MEQKDQSNECIGALLASKHIQTKEQLLECAKLVTAKITAVVVHPYKCVGEKHEIVIQENGPDVDTYRWCIRLRVASGVAWVYAVGAKQEADEIGQYLAEGLGVQLDTVGDNQGSAKLTDMFGGRGVVIAIQEEGAPIDANRANFIFDPVSTLHNYDLKELYLLEDLALLTGVRCRNRIEMSALMTERGTHLLRNQDGKLEEIDGITKQPRSRAESVAVTLFALGKFSEVKFPVEYGSYYSKVTPVVKAERLKRAEATITSMDFALQRNSEDSP